MNDSIRCLSWCCCLRSRFGLSLESEDHARLKGTPAVKAPCNN